MASVVYTKRNHKRNSKPLPRNAAGTRSELIREPLGAYTALTATRKVVSLFSGAMGLDLGLTEAGLQIAISQDFDPWCVETMRQNTTHPVLPGDIRKLVSHDPSCSFLLEAASIKRDEVFAVVGGPPCQAFSTAGKRKGETDERGGLYKQFIHVVEKLRPRFFVMENVKGLVSMPSIPGDPNSEPLLNSILKTFRSATKYHIIHGVLDAVHYGVPQFRERLVIIGSRDREPVFLPSPSHFQLHQNKNLRWRTLRDTITDLEDFPGSCTAFSPKIQHYLEMVPEGGNWRSLPRDVLKEAMGGAYDAGGGKVGFFRRLKYDEPSPTLVTSPIQKATILCHPTRLRPLSVREYMRLQQFPDMWTIKGALSDCYRQIGNAVPVGLGKALGDMLVAVASGQAHIHAKRIRGTSVHSEMVAFQQELLGERNGTND